MREPHASGEGHPPVDFERILQEDRRQSAGRILPLSQRQTAAVGRGQAEQPAIALPVGVYAHACIVALRYGVERDLRSSILGIELVEGAQVRIVGASQVVCPVEVIERRDGENQAGRAGMRRNDMDPGKVDQSVIFPVQIADSAGLVVRTIRNLVVIPPDGRNQTKLVRRGSVKNERAKAAEPVSPVVDDGGGWGLQPLVAAIPVQADIVSQAFGVASEVKLVIGLVKAAISGGKLGFVV